MALSTLRLEDKSTEEALFQLHKAAEVIRTDGCRQAMVGSLDVHALYPSLDHRQSAKLVERAIIESEAKLSNIDYRAAQVYIASSLTELEVKDRGLKKLLPRRRARMGRCPGPTTPELGVEVKDPDKPDEPTSVPTKWDSSNPPEKMEEKDLRRLLAVAVGVAVETVFSHHIYKFGGACYRQLKGRPIGLRLTSLVARLVMDMWSK